MNSGSAPSSDRRKRRQPGFMWLSFSRVRLRHPELSDLASFPAFAADEVASFRAFLARWLAPAP
jgi:hypothetical protein